MGRSYTIKYFGFPIDKDNKRIFLDDKKTRSKLYTGMNIKEVLRGYLSSNNYKLCKGDRILIYEQLHPLKEFIIELTNDLILNVTKEGNIIKEFLLNGQKFDYWYFNFKGYYKRVA